MTWLFGNNWGLLCIACFSYPGVHITKCYTVVIHNASENCGAPFDHVVHLESKRPRIHVLQYWTYFSIKRVGAQIPLHHGYSLIKVICSTFVLVNKMLIN
jgi:hypothetical protein